MSAFDSTGEFDVPAGEQYTSDWNPANFLNASTPPEKTVRPFESYKERRDQRLEQLRRPPGDDVEADTVQACWGGAGTAQFPESTTNPPFDLGGFNTKKNKDNPNEPEEPGIEQWTENQRQSKRVKVVSEEDPEVFVFIKVAQKSLITLGNGRRVMITWLDTQSPNTSLP